MIPALTALGIISPVQDYFAPWIAIMPGGHIAFKYGKTEMSVQEHYSAMGHIVPVSTDIWTAGAAHPNAVRHSFLFLSAIEVLSFCSVNPVWLAKPGNCVFSALGLLPLSGQIRELRFRYPNARLHAVYGNDLVGRVMDCKTALWSKEKDAAFSLQRDLIIARYHGKTFRIPEQQFSLSRFQQLCGLRAGLRTHKPKTGYSCFYELISYQPQ